MPGRDELRAYLEQMPLDTGETLTTDQVGNLMALTFTDGRYALDPSVDSNLAYQICGQVRDLGFEVVWRSLFAFTASGNPRYPLGGTGRYHQVVATTRPSDGRVTSDQHETPGATADPTTINSGQNDGHELWLASAGLSDAALQNQAILDIRMSRLEIGESIYKCPRCSKQETIFYQMQTRSADEPMTINVQCVLCHHAWNES